jgi:hypothetical protein
MCEWFMLRRLVTCFALLTLFFSHSHGAIIYIHNFTMDTLNVTVHGKTYNITDGLTHGVVYLWNLGTKAVTQGFTLNYLAPHMPLLTHINRLNLESIASSDHFLRALATHPESFMLSEGRSEKFADAWGAISNWITGAAQTVSKTATDVGQGISQAGTDLVTGKSQNVGGDLGSGFIKAGQDSGITKAALLTAQWAKNTVIDPTGKWAQKTFSHSGGTDNAPTVPFDTPPFSVPGVDCATYFGDESLPLFMQYVQTTVRSTKGDVFTPGSFSVRPGGEFRWVGDGSGAKAFYGSPGASGSCSASFPQSITVTGPSGSGTIDVSEHENDMIVTVAVGYHMSISPPPATSLGAAADALAKSNVADKDLASAALSYAQNDYASSGRDGSSCSFTKNYKIRGYAGHVYDPVQALSDYKSPDPGDPRSATYDRANVPVVSIQEASFNVGLQKTSVTAKVGIGPITKTFDFEMNVGFMDFFKDEAIVAKAIWQEVEKRLEDVGSDIASPFVSAEKGVVGGVTQDWNALFK